MKRFSFLLILGTLISVFLISSVFAADVVRIDSSKIRLSIAPGQTKVGVINVENPSSEPKVVKMYIEDWYYIAPFDGAKEFKPAGTTALSGSHMITFSPAQLILGPYAKQTVNYTIKVPENASGGYYGVLFFESSLGAPDTQGVGVSVSVRIASLFYIEASSTIKKELAWKNLTVEKKSEKEALKIILNVKNEGNIDITASGNFNIIDKKGKVYARGDFSSVYTFPKDEASLIATWNAGIPDGIYDVIVTIDLGKAQEEAGLGRGPVVVKESTVEISNGQIIQVGEFK